MNLDNEETVELLTKKFAEHISLSMKLIQQVDVTFKPQDEKDWATVMRGVSRLAALQQSIVSDVVKSIAAGNAEKALVTLEGVHILNILLISAASMLEGREMAAASSKPVSATRFWKVVMLEATETFTRCFNEMTSGLSDGTTTAEVLEVPSDNSKKETLQ